MWRSQEKNSSFSPSPDFSLPWVKSCEDAHTLWQAEPAGSSILWGGSSEGKQDMGCGKERVITGTKLPYAL